MSLNLSGVGVAIVTPFKSDFSVDFNALQKLTNHIVEGGISYIVVQGTTGETPTLKSHEKAEILQSVIEANQQRVPIILGLGGNNTQGLIEEMQQTNLEGVSAILSASPYYNKPNQEGIFQHYKALNDAAEIPIIVYNVPGRTSSNILPETQVKLANELSQIIAVKEASGNIEQKAKVIHYKPEHFQVLSGDDAQIVAECALGSVGIISVIANAFPKQFSKVVKLCLNQQYPEARNLFYKLRNMIDLLFADGNPAGIKAALKVLGICGETVRLPLVPVNRALYQKIESEVAYIQEHT